MKENFYRPTKKLERLAPKIAARIQKQIKMRESGKSFTEIAESFHMSENYVRKCINETIKKRNKNG